VCVCVGLSITPEEGHHTLWLRLCKQKLLVSEHRRLRVQAERSSCDDDAAAADDGDDDDDDAARVEKNLINLGM